MSRQTKFEIELIPGNAQLRVSVQLEKSTDDQRISFKSTYDKRPIRMIKVLIRDDEEKPTAVADIEKIVPWNGTVSAYAYQDEETGGKKLVYLEEKDKCSIFKQSNLMKTISIINAEEVTPNMYAGNHYFVELQKGNKSKVPAQTDQQGYSLLYFILNDYKKMLLVKFVSGDREKFAVIYPVGNILMLSTIIHYNYQRQAPNVSRIPLPKAKAHAEALIAKLSQRRFDYSVATDKYHEALTAYIEQLKNADKGGKVKIIPRIKKQFPVDENDFFSAMDALS